MTNDQAREAYAIGLQRHTVSRANGQAHQYGYGGTARQQRETDAFAAVAEYFVALETGREWVARVLRPGKPGEPDVAPDIQVRWTGLVDGGLVAHPSDVDSHRIVLVRGKWPTMQIYGWAPALEVKLEKFWRTTGLRHPCFIRPAESLERRGISELMLDCQLQLEDIGRKAFGIKYGEDS